MKITKIVLAVMLVSLIATSCNETKKGADKDLKDAVEATEEAVGDAVEATEEAVGDAVEATEEAVGDAVEATEEAVGDAVEATEEAVSDAVEATEEAVEEVINWVDVQVVYPKDTKLQKQVFETKAVMAKGNPKVGKIFGSTYGYAIFPKITKGGLVVGGAGGHGLVFVGNTVVGSATLMQATLGAQAGGQQYAEFILFEDKAAMDRFRNNKLKFAGELSAVAWDKAVSENIDYQNGVAVYTYSNKGLMAEVSAGTQKFKYKDGIK